MRRSVVLLQPRLGDMDQFRDRPTPPLGLLAAASKLGPDVEVRFVDQRVQENWRARLSSVIDDGTLAVGVTAFTGGMIRNAMEGVREVKRGRDIPVVWGGIHASLAPEQTVRHELIDYVVAGEGETVFANLVGALAAGSNGDGIPGVWSKNGGEVRSFGKPALSDLGSLPPVPYSLVDMESYISLYGGRRMFFYQSSRGCPCRCAYCYNMVFNRRRWRALSPERVISELASLKARYDFSLVYMLDDNFFIDKARAMAILSGLKRRGISVALQGVDVETLARFTDDDLTFLEEAGLERITVGVESGVERIRTGVLKKQGSMSLVRRQLGRLKGRKITVLCSIMIGVPSETSAETQQTVDFFLDLLRWGDNFRVRQLYNYIPYPGTEIYSALEREGFSFPSDLEGWGDYEWDHAQLAHNDAKRRVELERICFLSKFVDDKTTEFSFLGKPLQVLYDLYRPLARVRLSHRLLSPLPERWCYETLKGFVGNKR